MRIIRRMSNELLNKHARVAFIHRDKERMKRFAVNFWEDTGGCYGIELYPENKKLAECVYYKGERDYIKANATSILKETKTRIELFKQEEYIIERD